MYIYIYLSLFFARAGFDVRITINMCKKVSRGQVICPRVLRWVVRLCGAWNKSGRLRKQIFDERSVRTGPLMAYDSLEHLMKTRPTPSTADNCAEGDGRTPPVDMGACARRCLHHDLLLQHSYLGTRSPEQRTSQAILSSSQPAPKFASKYIHICICICICICIYMYIYTFISYIYYIKKSVYTYRV